MANKLPRACKACVGSENTSSTTSGIRTFTAPSKRPKAPENTMSNGAEVASGVSVIATQRMRNNAWHKETWLIPRIPFEIGPMASRPTVVPAAMMKGKIEPCDKLRPCSTAKLTYRSRSKKILSFKVRIMSVGTLNIWYIWILLRKIVI